MPNEIKKWLKEDIRRSIEIAYGRNGLVMIRLLGPDGHCDDWYFGESLADAFQFAFECNA